MKEKFETAHLVPGKSYPPSGLLLWSRRRDKGEGNRKQSYSGDKEWPSLSTCAEIELCASCKEITVLLYPRPHCSISSPALPLMARFFFRCYLHIVQFYSNMFPSFQLSLKAVADIYLSQPQKDRFPSLSSSARLLCLTLMEWGLQMGKNGGPLSTQFWVHTSKAIIKCIPRL